MKVIAPAKATLLLRILGRRDDGYHELEALIVSLSEPHDDVDIEPMPGDGVELTVDGDDAVPADGSNLAWKAAAALGTGARIRLVKRIPSQAGLGGGSADAAAVLRALDPNGARAAAVAPALGSDVPYCLHGGLAWMRGRGERIEPVAPVGQLIHLLVAVPPFRLATPAVYQAWDELGGPHASSTIDAPPALHRLTPTLSNDLEPAAERVEPRLRAWRRELEAAAGAPALMAGSGTAHLVLLEDAAERVKAQVIERLPGTEVWAATSAV